MDKYKPLVSIITVCLNAEKHLEQAIQSVLNQTYDNIEYIVIDGGSQDRSLEIIKKYNDKIAYWVSEPDAGIYNAMNKGATCSTGDIIYFLNSDDYFYDCSVVENIVLCFSLNRTAQVVYGNVVVYDQKDNFLLKVGREYTLECFKRGQMLPHQGLFMYRDILVANGLFNEQYRIAADFDLLIKCYIKGYKAVYNNLNVALFRLGGISNDRKYNYLTLSEYREIIAEHFDSYTLFKYSIKIRVHKIRFFIKDLAIRFGLFRYWRKYQMGLGYNNNKKCRTFFRHSRKRI